MKKKGCRGKSKREKICEEIYMQQEIQTLELNISKFMVPDKSTSGKCEDKTEIKASNQSSETETQRLACSVSKRRRMASRINRETLAQRLARLEKDRAYKAMKRKHQTEDAKVRESEAAKSRQEYKIATETQEQRRRRLERDRIRAALRRKNETEEQRNNRLYKDRIRKAIKRMEDKHDACRDKTITPIEDEFIVTEYVSTIFDEL